jgi:hypothetical protein
MGLDLQRLQCTTTFHAFELTYLFFYKSQGVWVGYGNTTLIPWLWKGLACLKRGQNYE